MSVSTSTKADISFRIGFPQCLTEERLDKLLALFGRHRGVTDELAFFTSETHSCLPLAVIEERAAILKRRMTTAREHGYRAGINILTTIGHHTENVANLLSGDYQWVTDLEGRVSPGALCPNFPHNLEYVRRLYETVAAAAPDFLWIDDDIRLFGHMPIDETCFCDHCLGIFREESGLDCGRGELKGRFNSSSSDDALRIRKAWLEHNRKTISRLLGGIEKTVHRIAPALPLGLMTGDRFYEGYDFDTWAGTLSGPEHVEVLWRPGGGFYTDDTMHLLIDKGHSVGRQCSWLPRDIVRSIQSEVESFPYQRLKKAVSTTALEAAVYIAGGCTGTAFNVLGDNDELDEAEPLVKSLARHRPFYDRLVNALGRSPARGIFSGWNKDTFSTVNLNGNWFKEDYRSLGEFAYELYASGLPPAYRLRDATATVLTGETVRAFSPDELLILLSGGVYMDAAALNCLNEMGYGEYTGFAADRVLERDCIEQFTDHPVNGELAGRMRDCRQSFLIFGAEAGVNLAPRAAGAQALSRLVDYSGREQAACACGTYENSLGGRICVAGYYPWRYLQARSKATQMKRLFAWLSKGKLSGWIESFHKINLWIRGEDAGTVNAVLVNTSMDDYEKIQVVFQSKRQSIELNYMDGKTKAIDSEDRGDGYRRLVVPRLKAWTAVLMRPQ